MSLTAPQSEPVSALHAAAREAAKIGPVFPCVAGEKKPLRKGWQADATQDPEKIDAIWREHPDANPAIFPDPAGLCVIDTDGEAGESAWLSLQIERGEFETSTLTVKTPRGGRHLYFKGVLPATQSKIAECIDTRGRGSYVLAPGAVVGGRKYIVESDVEPAPLPEWIPACLERNGEPREPSPIAGEPIAAKALEGMLAVLNPNMERAAWIGVAAALHAAPCTNETFDTRDLFVRWSRGEVGGWPTPSRYTSDEDCEKAFDSMRPKEGGIGVGSLIRFAREAGWTPPADGSGFAAIGRAGGVARLAPSPFRFLSCAEQSALPTPAWLVPGLIPEASVAMLYGEAGSFKSFIALSIALGIAAGVPALGFEPATFPKPTIYLAGEGPIGIAKKRRPAWQTANGLSEADLPFHLCPTVFALRNRDNVEEFFAALAAANISPALVVLDTAARAMAGLDENSAKDAGVLVEVAEEIKRRFNTSVLIVHHSGKDAQRGARGSSAIEAGVDTVIRCHAERESLAVKLTVTKQKDADPGEPIHLKGDAVAGSLVFKRVDLTEYRALTAPGDELTPSTVGAALRELNAIGVKASVETNVLATQILHARGDGPEDETERVAAVTAMSKRLRRAAGGSLRVFSEKTGATASAPWKWFLPSEAGND